jgi:hypothetical protein
MKFNAEAASPWSWLLEHALSATSAVFDRLSSLSILL